MLPLGILNISALAAAIVLSAFTLYRDPQRFAMSYAILVPFCAFFYLAFGTAMPAVVMVISVISAKYLYSRIFFYFAPLLFIIGGTLIFVDAGNIIWAIFDLSIGLGTSIGLLTDKQSMGNVSANDKSKGISKTKEVDRDLLQIASGIVILAILYGMGQNDFRITLSLAVVPIYIIGNYYSLFPSSKIGKTLSFFERPMTPLGLGAIWFAAGILIALGVVESTPLLAIIVFTTTIGDPLATIFGSVIQSPKLPYNHKKSIAGFLGIFLFSGAFGFIVIGYMGIGIALLAAFVESLSFHPLDDNFILPVVLGAISAVV